MGVKSSKVTSVQVPISNINQFVRFPDRAPTALAKVLQEWDGVSLRERKVSEPETPQEYRTVREVLVHVAEGPDDPNGQEYALPVTEQLYEVGLYTRATKRFGDWMRDNAGKPGTVPFA